ncbi:hypothetical protein [Microbulbifer mangrovi]|uniref:hypothetical protein n=1 Tax=Microbulbifer mangrovi TaxID=927787 RepID=UPI0009905EF9|nr:hypothetical protein [Microbulbifer mangrovi]
MNTQLPVKSPTPAKTSVLAAQHEPEASKAESSTNTGRSRANLGLRYPKELERCFVLGNN